MPKNGHIFSRIPDGRSFESHPTGARDAATDEAIRDVLEKNDFEQTKVRSFLRQLNIHGCEPIKKSVLELFTSYSLYTYGTKVMYLDV